MTNVIWKIQGKQKQIQMQTAITFLGIRKDFVFFKVKFYSANLFINLGDSF